MLRFRYAMLLAFAALPFAAPAQTVETVATQGDVLLVDRVQQENSAALPARGMTMAQVEARYGAPADRLDPRGGQKRAWPTINRWRYAAFTVYFEKSRVIDAVANQASPAEIGPKPAIR
jgi:hypothetical protein